MSSIRDGYNSLGKTFLTLAGNLWATGGFRVNLYIGEGGLLNIPLLLLKGNTILPMTTKADCELHCNKCAVCNVHALICNKCCV